MRRNAPSAAPWPGKMIVNCRLSKFDFRSIHRPSKIGHRQSNMFWSGLGDARLLWHVGGLKPFLRRTLPVIEEIQNNNPVIPNGVKDAYLLDDYKSSDSFFFVF